MNPLMFWVGGLFVGLGFGFFLYPIVTPPHPYETCSSLYDSVEDISECIWILNHER